MAKENGVEEDPGEIGVSGRADAELATFARGEFQALGGVDAEGREGAALEVGGGATDDEADERACAEGVGTDPEIEGGAGGSAGEGTCGGELPAAESPFFPGFAGGEVEA